MLATGARELPPSPIGPAGRWLAKVAALASVGALALSIGYANDAAGDDGGGDAHGGTTAIGGWTRMGGFGSSAFLCAAGVAVLCASFSVDFYQIWVVLPREAAAAAVGAPDAAAEGRADNGAMKGLVAGVDPGAGGSAAVDVARGATECGEVFAAGC